jgi:hypothetical protein
MPLEFIKSEKGKVLLVTNGYVFQCEKRKADKELWRCSNRTCKTRCQTANGDFVKEPSEHSHAVSVSEVAVRKIQTTVKRRTIETEEPNRVIIQSSSAELHATVQAALPKSASLSRNIARYRVPPPTPVGRLLPERLELTLQGCPFLRHESEWLLFAAEADLQFLRSCNVWFADGTFKVSPPQYLQLYTIHGFRDGISVPCVYALLPNSISKPPTIRY